MEINEILKLKMKIELDSIAVSFITLIILVRQDDLKRIVAVIRFT